MEAHKLIPRQCNWLLRLAITLVKTASPLQTSHVDSVIQEITFSMLVT